MDLRGKPRLAGLDRSHVALRWRYFAVVRGFGQDYNIREFSQAKLLFEEGLPHPFGGPFNFHCFNRDK
jgi:hypothetical protein